MWRRGAATNRSAPSLFPLHGMFGGYRSLSLLASVCRRAVRQANDRPKMNGGNEKVQAEWQWSSDQGVRCIEKIDAVVCSFSK